MSEDPVLFLMANLGSETTRLWRARDEGNGERMSGAYARACGIMKEINALPNAENARRELAILQEVLDDVVREEPMLQVRSESVRRYFIPFARRLMNV